jgi:glycosyltransferase involved in cell wall biosynthesis
MLVPVWIGSGIRTKILAAWAAACPVITTSVGVEGLLGSAGEDYLVADVAEEFVNSCREMVENHEKRNMIAKNCWNVAKEHFSLEAVCRKRLSIYNELIGK